MKAPVCKLCGAEHWAREPHQFGKSSYSRVPIKDAVSSEQVDRALDAKSKPIVGRPKNGPNKKSTGPVAQRQKSVAQSAKVAGSSPVGVLGEGQVLPVDTKEAKMKQPKKPEAKRPRGRPPGPVPFDKKAHDRDYQAKRRAKMKGLA